MWVEQWGFVNRTRYWLDRYVSRLHRFDMSSSPGRHDPPQAATISTVLILAIVSVSVVNRGTVCHKTAVSV